MASPAVPYPTSPTEVPEGYADFPKEYQSKQWTLVVCLLLFLGLYVWLVLAALGMTIIFVFSIPRNPFFGILGALFCLVMFIFLVKGLFHNDQPDKEMHLEVTEEDQPKLFGFIRQICEEIGVNEPNKVYVSPEVNAACITRTSLVNVFVPPKRDLLIGLGLVNAVNLSEFKAAMAHEFGHFAQGGFVASYFSAMLRIAGGIVDGRDGFDNFIDGLRKTRHPFTLVVGFILWAPMAMFRWITLRIYRLLAFQENNVRREREFHADRVAAALAGSNAITHTLYRLGFAAETYSMAQNELFKAADHKLFTADIYYHQHAVGDIIRKQKKDPEYGRPPRFTDPREGKKVQIFDPDKAEDHPPEDYHPPDFEREEHVKSPFVPCEEDTRSAWILFDDPVELREKFTYKMYRAGKIIKKGTGLDDPKVVQQFIDDEHMETTYDDKYCGAYDGRTLRPGDLDKLDELIRKEPWDDARLASVHGKMYEGLEAKVEDRNDIIKELEKLREKSENALSKKLKRKIKDLDRELEEHNEWFVTLDRRVYLVYVQMSYRVDHDLYFELVNRYRFHMAVQGIYNLISESYNEADFNLRCLNALDSMKVTMDVRNSFVDEVLSSFREARSAMKKVLREAKAINMPAMKNFEEGERLADFLLDEDLISEGADDRASGKWINKLFRQLGQIRRKSSRLFFKSLGQILSLQENVADQFLIKKGLKAPDEPILD